MKKLVAAVALATIIASPAFAQSFDPSVGSGNIVQKSTGNSALDAYAQHPGKAKRTTSDRSGESALFNRIGVE